jgi:hypothetical protein
VICDERELGKNRREQEFLNFHRNLIHDRMESTGIKVGNVAVSRSYSGID